MLGMLKKKKENKFPYTNIYHCCAHKTGSQWILSVFSDPIVKKHSGLGVYTYTNYLPDGIDTRKIDERFFTKAFPEHAIVSPMYISSEGFASIPKPGSFTSFFICRNPRDLVVSYYFSARFTHKENPKLNIIRTKLQDMEEEEAFIAAIRSMEEQGFFRSLRSWFEHPPKVRNFKIIRFEELTDFASGEVERFFLHCGLNLSSAEIETIKNKYSFAEMKKKDSAEGKGHYRSGGSDWKKYFTPAVENAYRKATGNLDFVMSYQ